MKKRFINVVKWFFIVLGVMFLLQTVLILGTILGIVSFSKMDFNKFEDKNSYGDFQPIINFVDNYYKENKSLPKTIENVKVKKNLKYTYEVDKKGECYSIKSKDEKNSKEYKNCMNSTENSSSNSVYYFESIEK